jgi:hypothetical protein
MMRVVAALYGALLAVGGIAAQILAARHRPLSPSKYLLPGPSATSWSTNAYDAVRIGGRALIIFGVVIVAFALIREIKSRPSMPRK